MWNKNIQEVDFSSRRKKTLEKIKNGVAVFFSAPVQIRNQDVTHPYRQDSNLYYLTGFEEANSICLLAPLNKTPFQIFVAPRDKTKELWEGKILGPERAKALLKADNAQPSTPDSHFDEAFINALAEANSLYYRVGLNADLDQRIFRLMAATMRKLGRTGRPFWPILDPLDILGELRVIKSTGEIERLKFASHITAQAHSNAMRMAKPGMYEYEVEAMLEHVFRQHGSRRSGFTSILASGPNACVLHYVDNNRKMLDKDLLLVDAGAEYDYYSSDITRTFPVRGTFTEPQKEVYSAVLKAQQQCIRLSRPGKTIAALQNGAIEILVEELKKLKVLRGPTQKLIKDLSYKAYYPHNIGHWLGMDVHDVGRYYFNKYSNHRKLEPGMVFTVEPGLYFGPHSPAPAKYKGIGVRIEDDVLITAQGCTVLTSEAPKEIEEVESLCSKG